MTIRVNDDVMEVPEGYTLGDLAAARQLPTRGVAMAVNNEMCVCASWSATILHEGDNVTILRAFAGG